MMDNDMVLHLNKEVKTYRNRFQEGTKIWQ